MDHSPYGSGASGGLFCLVIPGIAGLLKWPGFSQVETVRDCVCSYVQGSLALGNPSYVSHMSDRLSYFEPSVLVSRVPGFQGSRAPGSLYAGI